MTCTFTSNIEKQSWFRYS